MNGQSSHQYPKDGRHDDDAALTEFLASLMDYTPTVTAALSLSLSRCLSIDFVFPFFLCN